MLTDDKIRELILSFHSYHPYRLNGERNPSFNSEDGRILDLKNPKAGGHKKAVEHYKRSLCSALPKVVDVAARKAIGAIVPSHEAGKLSVGLLEVMKHVAAELKFTFEPNPLKRTATVDKLTDGGDRDKEVHLRSIQVVNGAVRKGAFVVLLDDVSTSGNSILACEELLLAAGAELVLKIAMAKTSHA